MLSSYQIKTGGEKMKKYRIFWLVLWLFLSFAVSGCVVDLLSLGVNAAIVAANMAMTGEPSEKKIKEAEINKDSLAQVIAKYGQAQKEIEFKNERVIVLEYGAGKEALNLLSFAYDEERREMVLREFKEVKNPETYYQVQQGSQAAFDAQIKRIFANTFAVSSPLPAQ
jgi:hypothetical protein